MEEKEEVQKVRGKKGNIILLIIALVILVIMGIVFWKVTIDKHYEIETITEISYVKLYENEKYGVMDIKGNILVEPKYDMMDIPNPSKPVFIGYFNYDSQTGKYQTEVLNDKNERILTQYTRCITTDV